MSSFSGIVVIGLSSLLVPLASAQNPPTTPFRVQLTQPLSTKANKKGDKVVAQVLLPADYKGDILQGEVKDSKSSGSFSKESVLNFGFNELYHQGQTIAVRAEVTKFYNSKGKENVDDEGRIIRKQNELGKAALITALGAGVGAAAGGGKGAAIGAGAGAAAGLLFAKFGTKAPDISFDTGSTFDVLLSNRR
jgi:hypothetical protein